LALLSKFVATMANVDIFYEYDNDEEGMSTWSLILFNEETNRNFLPNMYLESHFTQLKSSLRHRSKKILSVINWKS